ncbi:hypothetical protein ACU686_43980 [Yinghuangia aomiensis]
MLLVRVQHTYLVDGVERVVDHHDLVYRDPTAVRPAADSEDAETPKEVSWRLTLPTDPVTLFRFSALTANAHRIHYDHPYATEVEGHPGLLVHGPLLAVAMLELPRRYAPQASVRIYAYRFRRPCHAGAPVEITGRHDGADVLMFAGPSTHISGFASLTGPPPQ